MSVSIDNLGENVTNPEEARHSAQLYHQILEEMHQQKLNANVSLKLTHMGLDVDKNLAYEITSGLVEHAAEPWTIDCNGLHTKANNPAGKLIHDN